MRSAYKQQGKDTMKLNQVLPGLVSGMIGAALVACGQAHSEAVREWVAAYVVQPMVGTHNGPLELIVRNDSRDQYAMTEIRAGNDAGCYNDFAVTGSNYNDPSDGNTLGANEAFIVSESPCARMHIKANGGDIKFSTVGPSPQNRLYPNIQLKDGVVHIPAAECANAAPMPGTAGYVCADGAGTLWWVPTNGTPRAL